MADPSRMPRPAAASVPASVPASARPASRRPVLRSTSIDDERASVEAMAHALRAGRLSLLGALSRDHAGSVTDGRVTRAAGRLAEAADRGDAGGCVARLVLLAQASDARRAA